VKSILAYIAALLCSFILVSIVLLITPAGPGYFERYRANIMRFVQFMDEKTGRGDL
jgi:hypothetical protein